MFLKVSKKFLKVVFIFECINKTGHKMSTQEEHPIYNSLSVRAFSVKKYNKTHKSRLNLV